MKNSPSLPLAWGGAMLIALLLIMAVAVLLEGRQIEGQARSIETDSVPGLINGHTIRSAYSEGFICAIQTAGAATPDQRAGFLQHLAELDATARAACDDYAKTIHIDPRQDTANLETLLNTRDNFLGVRAQYLDGARIWPRAEAQDFFVKQLTPSYDALMRACDVLIAYNNRTGTVFSTSVVRAVTQLRWIVIAIVVLAVASAAVIGASLMRRARIERELRESESKFATVFRVSPHSMIIARRRDGVVLAANDAFQRENGLRPDEILGKSVVELGLWPSVEEREAMLQGGDRDGRVSNLVRERVLRDGRKITASVSTEPLVLEGEACLLSVAHDLTERVEAERALARSVAELGAIFESTAIGIALVSAEGRPIRCNPALERFLGYRSEELGRMTFAEFTHADDVERDVHLFQKLVRGELNFYQIEKRYLRKDGATVWGRLTVSVVRGPDGKLAYGIGMVEDVSEQKRAEQALRESESARQNLQEQLIVAQKLEAVGQLAGGVAHDFNNMLAAIMLHLDILRSDGDVAPAMQESLGELIQTARRAAGLTRQLLLFSRREPVQRQVVELNAIVVNLLKMLDRLVGEHLTLVHAGGPQPLWLLADSGMLEQVVLNLVVNARDAMPRGGRIVLRTDVIEVDEIDARRHPAAQAGRFVRLTVVDTGSGMNAATRSRIFEPFFTTKEAGKGTGLGLSTVFGIVQQHSGWIEVDSIEGKGSSFSVYLPAHSGPAVDHRPESAATPVASGCETILLAEDNEPVRLATARILRQHGYQVLEAGDGRTARALLDAQPGKVDLLLTDVVMPGGLMGHELAASLPADAHRPKVILMSGHNTHVDQATFETVASFYLAKPFDADRLLRVVRETLGDPAAKK